MKLKVMFIMFVVLSAIGLLGGCFGKTVHNEVSFDNATFQNMEAKWVNAAKDNYTFNYIETGAESNYNLKVKVVNGVRESISKNTEASAMRFDEELSIDSVIADIKNAYAENNDKTFERDKDVYITKIDVKYNAITGYPETVVYEYNKPAEGMKDLQKKIQVKMEI